MLIGNSVTFQCKTLFCSTGVPMRTASQACMSACVTLRGTHEMGSVGRNHVWAALILWGDLQFERLK